MAGFRKNYFLRSETVKFTRTFMGPLVIKASGMVITFGSVLVIINNYGLDLFGEYAKSISLLLFLSGIVAYGFPQSIFRDAALLNFFQKKKLFNEMLLITSYTSILISPILVLFFYFVEDFTAFQVVMVIAVFFLMATSRLRFSLLRTTRHVKFGEIPEQIIKPSVVIIILLSVPNGGIEVLYTALFFGLIGAFWVNLLLTRKYYALPSSFRLNKKLVTINLKDTNTKLWISNSLILFKDFIELFLIGFLFGDLVTGEYKFVLQMLVVFMAVFNTMALVNSMNFAKLIASKKFDQINNKVRLEMVPSILTLIFIALAAISIEFQFKISRYIPLSDGAVYSVLVFIGFSLINIMVGPVTQLLLHSRQIERIIAMTIIKIMSITGAAFLGILVERSMQLLFFCLMIVIIDAIVLLFAARKLNRIIGYIMPIHQNLKFRLSK